MAGKKSASKLRKPSKPAVKPATRKSKMSHTTARKRTASASKTARPKPAKASPRAAAAKAPAKPKRTLATPASIATEKHHAHKARPEVDESDLEAGSLLAGPRNVTPYIVQRGELYMGKEQLAHFQRILAEWKHDLMLEVDRTVSYMKDEAANFPDPNDRATQEEEFSLELRTRDRERKLIRKIDEALKRIEDGSYGYCLETGEEIGLKRLEARPVATLSIEAQERRERRERQYGDRDDRYR
jgi:DnaK suppressor protein